MSVYVRVRVCSARHCGHVHPHRLGREWSLAGVRGATPAFSPSVAWFDRYTLVFAAGICSTQLVSSYGYLWEKPDRQRPCGRVGGWEANFLRFAGRSVRMPLLSGLCKHFLAVGGAGLVMVIASQVMLAFFLCVHVPPFARLWVPDVTPSPGHLFFFFGFWLSRFYVGYFLFFAPLFMFVCFLMCDDEATRSTYTLGVDMLSRHVQLLGSPNSAWSLFETDAAGAMAVTVAGQAVASVVLAILLSTTLACVVWHSEEAQRVRELDAMPTRNELLGREANPQPSSVRGAIPATPAIPARRVVDTKDGQTPPPSIQGGGGTNLQPATSVNPGVLPRGNGGRSVRHEVGTALASVAGESTPVVAAQTQPTPTRVSAPAPHVGTAVGTAVDPPHPRTQQHRGVKLHWVTTVEEALEPATVGHLSTVELGVRPDSIHPIFDTLPDERWATIIRVLAYTAEVAAYV